MRGQNSALLGEFDVQITVSADHGFQAEMLDRAPSCRFAKLLTKTCVTSHPLENRCESCHISWLEKPSRAFLFDQLGIPADSGCDHRQTRGHGFQERVRHTLAERRNYEYVHGV